jgi:LacI family transcriptional regulator
VLLVAGLQEFSGHGERKQGFLGGLSQDFPNCRVTVEIDSLDHGAAVADSVAAALTRNPNIRGIYNISQGNDAITQQIKQQGMPANFVFICHDLTPTTIELLRARLIDVVIDQDPISEAKRAIELVLQHYGRLAGRQVSGATPLRLFLRENIEGEPS